MVTNDDCDMTGNDKNQHATMSNADCRVNRFMIYSKKYLS